MTRALHFLLTRGFKNRLLLRLNRLRRPKYLISILVGLVFLSLVFFQPFYPDLSALASFAADTQSAEAVQSGFALLLFGAVVFYWLFAGERNELFGEAETQWLFPAPISRRALLHYHMAKAQIGIMFGTILSALVFGRSFAIPSAGFFVAGIWIVYFFLYLCRVAVILLKKALIERGTQDLKLKAWVLGFIALAGCAAAAWMRWVDHEAMGLRDPAPAGPAAWFLNITGSGPAYYLLVPFRMMVRPIFACDYSQFALCLGPALGILVFIYGWIQYSKTDLGKTLRSGIAKRGRRMKERQGFRSRRPPFPLAAKGEPFVALYWKNLILSGGLDLHLTLAALAASVLISILLASASVDDALMIIGAAAAALAGFLTLLGPILFREDLRTDLKNIDLLKTYPIPGWGIVLGEALGPATVLAILEWELSLLAAAALPSFGNIPWQVSDRIFWVLAAAMLMPLMSFLGVLVQNAAVLLLPSWVQLGREHPQGVEAMGQRLITSAATLFLLLVAALLPAALFFAVMQAGYPMLGTAVLPLASLPAAMVLLLEAGAAISWLGRIYDRFDAAYE